MPESEKKTGAEKKKRSKKSAKSSAKAKEPQPAPRQLDREQLEALREKLQRKFH